METAQKNEIKLLTQVFIDAQKKQGKSQKQAIALLKDTSEATIIKILQNDWNNIADKMWRNIGKQVGWTTTGTTWQMVETINSKILTTFFEDAKEFNNVIAITGNPGSSKSYMAEYYAKHHANVYHIECDDYWNRKMFLSKVLEKMGKRDTGYNIGEMMEYIVDVLRKQDTPLLIIDEADKLNDQVLYFFITLYNRLKGKCGIVLLATDYLEKRIMRGIKLKKRGFAEIFSRIGKGFIELGAIATEELEKIIRANGIEDQLTINEIINQMDGDLRLLERKIHAHKRIQERKNNKAA